jgi:hypothetical protein
MKSAKITSKTAKFLNSRQKYADDLHLRNVEMGHLAGLSLVRHW